MSRHLIACPSTTTHVSRSHRPTSSGAAALTLLALCLGLTGCATLPSGKPDPRDRFERFNRIVFVFNTKLDHALLRPVARELREGDTAADPHRRSTIS